MLLTKKERKKRARAQMMMQRYVRTLMSSLMDGHNPLRLSRHGALIDLPVTRRRPTS
jgi:hypothetical protein